MALSRSKRLLNRLEAENRQSRRAGALSIFSGVLPAAQFRAAMQFCESNPTSSWRSTAALYEQGSELPNWNSLYHAEAHVFMLRFIYELFELFLLLDIRIFELFRRR